MVETLIELPDDFPLQKVMDIGDYLQQIDVLVPDYPDPNGEVYFLGNHLAARIADGVQTTLLPDRNVVSRMAQVAKGNSINPAQRNAAAILAFAQCLEILIEPSIAFHEMAFNEGHDAALEELSWFRVADNGAVQEWMAAALGARDRIITVGEPKTITHPDLAKPLKRWRRNYIVALKIGELELRPGLSSLQRVIALLEWMRDDFILAGPAALLAFMYFAPNSPPRRGLLKGLRSDDRQEALAGVKNAAWDITYLSDFARRINESSESQRTRYVFATFDKRLRDLARFVIGEYEALGAGGSLAKSFERWWSAKDAQLISEVWMGCLARTREASWWDQFKDRPNYIDELIAESEAALLAWKSR